MMHYHKIHSKQIFYLPKQILFLIFLFFVLFPFYSVLAYETTDPALSIYPLNQEEFGMQCIKPMNILYASYNGCVELAKEILEKRDVTLDEINNALLVSLNRRHEKIAALLLENGADPSFEDDKKWTPIMWAADNECHETIKLLREKYKVNAGQSQEVIKYNLGLFLEKFSSIDSGFIKKFKEDGGFCYGLSTFWLYAKWLDFEAKNSEKYNNKWRQNIVKTICDWNGEDDLGRDMFSDFEKFISIIETFQNPNDYCELTQEDVGELILKSELDTNDKRLYQRYTIAGEFTLNQLIALLNKIVYDDELIYVRSIGHATALLKHGDCYYYYNPAIHEGEIQESSIDKIATIIFDLSLHDEGEAVVLGFKIWSFNEKSHAYPKQKDILINTNPTKEGLNKAVEIRCLDSLKFFLDHGVNLNNIGSRGKTPLWFAIQNNFTDGIMLLLNRGVKVEDDVPSLMYALKLGRFEIVRELFVRGANPNAQIMNMPIIIWAAYNGYNKAVEILLNYGADPGLTMEDKEGKTITVYEAALVSGNTETVNLLKERKVHRCGFIKPFPMFNDEGAKRNFGK